MSPMPSRNSIITYFALGATLLVVPLILVFTTGTGCSMIGPNQVCTTSRGVKELFSFMPFVMVIGGVLIGYNLKRISDSLVPRNEDEYEPDNEK